MNAEDVTEGMKLLEQIKLLEELLLEKRNEWTRFVGNHRKEVEGNE